MNFSVYLVFAVSQGTKLSICDEVGIPYTASTMGIPNPTVDFFQLSPYDQEDLLAQVDDLTYKVHVKFLGVQAKLIASLKRMNVTPEQIIQTLKAHTCRVSSSGDSIISGSLFQEHMEELSVAKNVEEVFTIITPYFSYFNYELLEVIIEVHGSDNDKQNMRVYLHDFNDFCRKVPCVEVHKRCDVSEAKRTEVYFKLDYDKNSLKHGDVKRIQRQIAKILNVRPSVLFLNCIKDGCVLFEFLIPTHFVDFLTELIDGEKATLQSDVKMLSSQRGRHVLKKDCKVQF